jgi:hypothetical protein
VALVNFRKGFIQLIGGRQSQVKAPLAVARIDADTSRQEKASRLIAGVLNCRRKRLGFWSSLAAVA